MEKTPLVRKQYLTTYIFVTSVFMLWGIALSMGDVLNKHFQNILHISMSQSGLVQLSLFGAYGIMGIPAGLFMKKFGYKKGIILGLILYGIGAFLFIPAAGAESFGFFRFALFILACGLATLETVAHPFSAALGDEEKSEQRINLSQTFNAVGTILGPIIGAYLILGEKTTGTGSIQNDLFSVKVVYAIIGLVVISIAIAFSFVKVPSVQIPIDASTRGYKELFKIKHFRWAAVTQFFNVAAQGATWAFFINYGVTYMEGMSDRTAATFFSVSMAMMLLGRLVGTYLMNFIAPNKLLAIFAFGSICFCLGISQHWGWFSFACLISLQFTFSIMFPTIFGLGLRLSLIHI